MAVGITDARTRVSEHRRHTDRWRRRQASGRGGDAEALNLAIAVQQEITARLDETDRLRHRQVESAQNEADHARHHYMQVDLSNRLVADSLKAD